MPQPDTSLYPQNPGPANPLTAMQGMASLQSTMQENQLRNQEIRGRVALGRIVQKNTDPNTGQVNPSGLMKDVASNPDAKLFYLKTQQEYNAANPLTEYMGTNQQGQPTPAKAPQGQVPGVYGPLSTQEGVDKSHAHLDALSNTLEPLANDPDVDHKKLIRGVADLVAHPDAQFNAMDGATALSKIPFGQNGEPPGPKEIHEGLAPILDQIKQTKANLSASHPSSTQKAQQSNPTDLSTPGVATGLPVGYTSPLNKSRENYDEVVDNAKASPTQNAAYNEIINLNKAGTETGTALANMYQAAARNDPLHILSGASDQAIRAQEMAKWMSQGLLAAGMPGSDARLQELQHGNLNPAQLSSVIKELAPFFKAVSQGAIKKQEFYNHVTSNGTDLTGEPAAAQSWNSHYDPRWLEYDELAETKDKRSFLVKHPDLIEKRQNYHALQQMGIIGGR